MGLDHNSGIQYGALWILLVVVVLVVAPVTGSFVWAVKAFIGMTKAFLESITASQQAIVGTQQAIHKEMGTTRDALEKGFDDLGNRLEKIHEDKRDLIDRVERSLDEREGRKTA